MPRRQGPLAIQCHQIKRGQDYQLRKGTLIPRQAMSRAHCCKARNASYRYSCSVRFHGCRPSIILAVSGTNALDRTCRPTLHNATVCGFSALTAGSEAARFRTRYFMWCRQRQTVSWWMCIGLALPASMCSGNVFQHSASAPLHRQY